jgi:CRISPR/Cas system CSM-associated protein Csm2 small subunit
MKTSLEEMEALVDVFEERLDKMDTTDLEAN